MLIHKAVADLHSQVLVKDAQQSCRGVADIVNSQLSLP